MCRYPKLYTTQPITIDKLDTVQPCVWEKGVMVEDTVNQAYSRPIYNKKACQDLCKEFINDKERYLVVPLQYKLPYALIDTKYMDGISR